MADFRLSAQSLKFDTTTPMMGVHWAATCAMQWFIVLGRKDYNCFFFSQLEYIATLIPWNWVEMSVYV